MISVIVPVYNVEKYLRKCVKSIQRQTHKDLEIILVDDGSPDECPTICDELSQHDNRIKVIHKENGGLSSARNEGLNVATGDYVTFVDSDDVITPQMYERMIQVMSATNADISMCGCHTVTDGRVILATDKFAEGKIYEGEDLIRNIILPLKTASWNKIFKRSAIGASRFPEGKIHGEDLVFLMNVVTPDIRLVTTEYIGYNYFKRGNSITTSSFNIRSFDEIWCKDRAAMIMQEKFPTFEKKATLWRFRARMNIIRVITKAHAFSQYSSEVAECDAYLKTHYKDVKDVMRCKEDLEYLLFMHCRWLYCLLIFKY